MQIKGWLRQSLPNRCQLCQQPVINGHGLCHCCLSDDNAAKLCICCTKPLLPDSTQQRCGACLSKKRWRPLWVAYPYQTDVGQLVAQMKVKQHWHLLEPLCQSLATKLQHEKPQSWPSALVPIPMHPSKLRQRSCNHALLIALELGRLLDLPVKPELLIKTQPTPSQHQLTGAQRRQNLKGSFMAPAYTAEPNIALVDDIVTTGTTMALAAAALKRSGHNVSQYWALASAMARR